LGARLSMIGLLVEDMGRSLGFYRTLGLTIPEGSEEETHVEVEVGGGLILFWDAAFVGTYDANREEPNGGYRIVPKFFVGSEKAVDALYAKLVADGHRGHKAPFGTHFGVYMAMVDDPDGDTVLLTAGQRPTAT
jgi:predicted lactoylglutathione lyase